MFRTLKHGPSRNSHGDYRQISGVALDGLRLLHLRILGSALNPKPYKGFLRRSNASWLKGSSASYAGCSRGLD